MEKKNERIEKEIGVRETTIESVKRAGLSLF